MSTSAISTFNSSVPSVALAGGVSAISSPSYTNETYYMYVSGLVESGLEHVYIKSVYTTTSCSKLLAYTYFTNVDVAPVATASNSNSCTLSGSTYTCTCDLSGASSTNTKSCVYALLGASISTSLSYSKTCP